MTYSKKTVIAIISILPILTLVILIGYIIYLNRDDAIVDINEVFIINVLGTEGYGYVDVSVNPDFIEKTGVDLSRFSYSVSQDNMLCNGDTIVITVDDAANLTLNVDNLKYVISGLKEGTDFNIFKDLIIRYDEQLKKIELDNSECSEFVKENVMFSIKRELSEYSRGDIVEIIGYVDMNAARDNQYNILATTLEYVIE